MVEFEIINNNILEKIKEILPDGELISFLNGNSKRIRSKLAILFIKSHGKNIDSNLYDILTACELIHNASLLHDDVIDDSELRRGITTIGKKYSSNISILCGDYVVSDAINLLLKLGNDKISDIFNKCVKNMAVAEVKQYFLRGKTPSVNEYIEICRGKTAGLFSAVLEGCAIYHNLDINLASKFGELFGICFQIKNDLEAYSSKQDIKNNLHTVLDILGIENTTLLSDNYKQQLRALLEKFPDNNYTSELKDIVQNL